MIPGKTIADAVKAFTTEIGLDENVQKGIRLVESLPEEPPRDEVGAKRQEVVDERTAEERKQAARLRELVDVWGVPFLDAKQILYGEVADTKALAAARRLLELRQYGAILVLSGPNGVGKSLAASWAVIQGPPREYPFGGPWPSDRHPRFISVGDLQRVSIFGDDADWKAYKNASVLAIDDVGTEYKDDKGAFSARFDQLLAHREKAPCWTILTTNLFARREGQNADSFAGKYGERVLDRLGRQGCAMVHLQGDSLRQSTGKKTTPWPQPTSGSTPTGSTPTPPRRPPSRG